MVERATKTRPDGVVWQPYTRFRKPLCPYFPTRKGAQIKCAHQLKDVDGCKHTATPALMFTIIMFPGSLDSSRRSGLRQPVCACNTPPLSLRGSLGTRATKLAQVVRLATLTPTLLRAVAMRDTPCESLLM